VILTDGIIKVSHNVVRIQNQGGDVKHPTQQRGKHVALMSGFQYPTLKKILNEKRYLMFELAPSKACLI
jgi:hypothetical protein